MVLPFEIVVLGIPASAQAKGRSKAAWKIDVAQKARTAVGEDTTPVSCEVEIRIVYFHDQTPLDVDNMIKPIQDALCGIVYEDDAQVADAHASRRDLAGKFTLAGGLSSALAEGFVAGGPFVHIKVSLAPDPSELLS